MNLQQRVKNCIHLLEAVIANFYYGFPSKNLKVIGITGTDGKTTTTILVYHILKNAGKKVSVISTVYAKIGDKEYDTGLHTTTPNAFEIQKLIKKSVKKGDDYLVLETTSHAIDQHRVWGIDYDISGLTNITPEHLDYHRNFQNYLKTKTKLLQRSKIAVINKDDQSYMEVSTILSKSNHKFYTYSLKSEADYTLDLGNKLNIDLPEFNKYNYLLAYSITSLLKINENKIIKAIGSYIPPNGRLDLIYDKEFKVIIDFAHTPNAFEQLLSYLSTKKKNGRLIHVFGAAGLRDKQKRPLMGNISGKYSDIIIITEEDYRTEDPKKIAQQIETGVKQNKSKQYFINLDRESAIKEAIGLSKKNDIIVITGKGHEKSLCRGSKEYNWSDKNKALKYLKDR